MKTETLSPELLHEMDAYWRAANYLSVGLGARQRQAFDAAERERFLAVIPVPAQTERGLDAAAHAGSAKQEARWKSLSHSLRRTTTRFYSIWMGC
jgi:hypothetical protein